jgi:multisite-specific tRNA:(cytosine-C5)-methyltransferase/tRNA (cytosine34-C5)-methyltransferase
MHTSYLSGSGVCCLHWLSQGIVPDGDWDQFLETLRNPLPVTFRINGSGRFADHLRDKLQSDFFSHFSEGPMVTVSASPAVILPAQPAPSLALSHHSPSSDMG